MIFDSKASKIVDEALPLTGIPSFSFVALDARYRTETFAEKFVTVNQSAPIAKTPIILSQIAGRLHEIFDGLIDLQDVANKSEADIENVFISRSYLALYFLSELNLTPEEAGKCITDGGLDGGIDGVYVDKSSAKVYFGQSKWRSNMNKGVALDEFVRFRDGVKNALNLNWTDRNKNLHRFADEIESQLKQIDTEVHMIFAHTSEQELSDDINESLDSFLLNENKYNSDFVRFNQFKVAAAARAARSHTRPENIDISVMLAYWGLIPSPYKSVYGSVNALDVVQWFAVNSNKLFAENLRYGVEKSDVNEGIIGTASEDPGNFWYYNNGVTAICDSIQKQPLGGSDTTSGVFDIKKISVINGAQTITSLAKAKAQGADLKDVRVHLRIISLADTPEDFSSNVTSANNTQNDLSPVDFVAADPNQERIAKEAAQLGLVYTFRRGDKDPERDHGFTIRSATIAAACSSGDLRLAVSAKRYISGLWENTKREPYTKLFNEKTKANDLWRCVQIMNVVDAALAAEATGLSGRERLIAVHANRFLLFFVFEILSLDAVLLSEDFDSVKNMAVDIVIETLSDLNRIISEQYSEAYPGNIFKNQERQTEILELLRS